ncbi:MAG: acyl--CoA ligase [SAR324 cluster bacterium]|nr:acyl--CoA ligase [SAR324 cluster bacterium]
MLIGELVERRGLKSPDLVFWDAPEGRFTYGELSAASERVARALAAEGLTPGHHAAICAETGFDYVTAHFGAARAGLVLAHLNPRFTPSELAALGAHCDARLLFFGAPQTAAVAEARPALKATRRFVRLPGPAGEAGAQPPPDWAMGWEEWLGQGEGRAFSPPDGLSPESPFQLLYTSGTTGAPKGALISHRAKIRQGLTRHGRCLVATDNSLGGATHGHGNTSWYGGRRAGSGAISAELESPLWRSGARRLDSGSSDKGDTASRTGYELPVGRFTPPGAVDCHDPVPEIPIWTGVEWLEMGYCAAATDPLSWLDPAPCRWGEKRGCVRE